MTEIFDLYDLMMEQLRDLYDGEQQQIEALKRFDNMASSPELRELIEHHQNDTKYQLRRLEMIFEHLDEEQEGESCDGMRGLILETDKLVDRCSNNEVRDAAIITSLQHMNHYEIAGYGTAISYAKVLGRTQMVGMLMETLREEKNADLGLSDLADMQVNLDARWHTLVMRAEQSANTAKR